MKRKLLAILLALNFFSVSTPLTVFAEDTPKVANYENSYTSLVYTRLDSKIEALEIQLLKLASIDKQEDVLGQLNDKIKNDFKLSGEDVPESIFSSITTSLTQEDLMYPIKVITETNTEATNAYLDALSEKVLKVYEVYASGSIQNKNARYTTAKYINDIINLTATFPIKEDSKAYTNLFSDDFKTKRQNLVSDLVAMEADGVTNLLEKIDTPLYSEEASTYKAKKLYETVFTPVNGGKDFYYSKEILEGKALSATYIPLRTNIDNNKYLSYVDSETFIPFYNTFGKLRKAVLKADSGKAVSQYYLTGEVPSYSPATLRDFIEDLDEEKLFIVDPGYYNIDRLKEYNFVGTDSKIPIQLNGVEINPEESATATESTEMPNIDDLTTESTTQSSESSETTTNDLTSESTTIAPVNTEPTAKTNTFTNTLASIFAPTKVYGASSKNILKEKKTLFDSIQNIYTRVENNSTLDSEVLEPLVGLRSEDPEEFYKDMYRLSTNIDYYAEIVADKLATTWYDSVNEDSVENLITYNLLTSLRLLEVANTSNLSQEERQIAQILGMSLLSGTRQVQVAIVANNILGGKITSLGTANIGILEDIVKSEQFIPAFQTFVNECYKYSVQDGEGYDPKKGKVEFAARLTQVSTYLSSLSDAKTYGPVISVLFEKLYNNIDGLDINALLTHSLYTYKTRKFNGEIEAPEGALSPNVNGFSIPDPSILLAADSSNLDTLAGYYIQSQETPSSDLILQYIDANTSLYNNLFNKKALISTEILTDATKNSGSIANAYMASIFYMKGLYTSTKSKEEMSAQAKLIEEKFKIIQDNSLTTAILKSLGSSSFKESVEQALGLKPGQLDKYINGEDGFKLEDLVTNLENLLNDAHINQQKENLAADKEDDPLFQMVNSIEGLTEEGVKQFMLSLPPESMRAVWDSVANSEFDLNQSVSTQASLLQSKLLDGVLNSNVISRMTNMNTLPNEWYGVSILLDTYSNIPLLEKVSGSSNKPIYRSAPNLKEAAYFDATFNNLYLRNISNMYPVRYDMVNDLDQPVFVDIFGNIVSYSGYVIVPFAANATLHSKVPLLNNAFLSSYGKEQYIEMKYETVQKETFPFINDTIFDLSSERALNSLQDYSAFGTALDLQQNILIPDEQSKTYILNPIQIDSDVGQLNLSRINTTGSNSTKVLYNIMLHAYTSETENSLWSPDSAFINMKADLSNVYQVLRGAPISDIDIVKEGLGTSYLYDQTAISQGIKFEELHDQIESVTTNGLITVPDLSTNVATEQVMYLIFKVLVIGIIVYLSIHIFTSAIRQTLNFYSGVKMVVGSLLIIAIILNVGNLHKWTYYYLNRLLLQTEAKEVVLLNSEKALNNSAIGISKIKTNNIESNISLKVAEVPVDKTEFIKSLLNAGSASDLTEFYETYYKSSPEASVDDYTLRGDTLYYSVDDLFKSSMIHTDVNTHKLSQYTVGEPAIAFRLPYYAILDYLLYQVNSYNEILDSYQYSLVSVGDGYRSQGLVERYFNGNGFLLSRKSILEENELIPHNLDPEIKEFALYDRAGVYNIYSKQDLDNRDIFQNKELMKNSVWYADSIDDETLHQLAAYLDTVAIKWVEQNKSVLGRFTDETILKSLALELSLAYNRFLNVDGPKYYEIDSIDTSDVLRLALVPNNEIISSSVYSYPRLVLQYTGTIGIILASFLDILLLILSFLKPLSVIASIVMLLIGLVIRRLILGKNNNAIFGALKYFVLVGIVNISYCFSIKILVALPDAIPSLVTLILLLIFSIMYVIIYASLIAFCFRNTKDAGYEALKIENIKVGSLVNNHFKSNLNNTDNNEVVGSNYYENLKNRDRRRRISKD